MNDDLLFESFDGQGMLSQVQETPSTSRLLSQESEFLSPIRALGYLLWRLNWPEYFSLLQIRLYPEKRELKCL